MQDVLDLCNKTSNFSSQIASSSRHDFPARRNCAKRANKGRWQGPGRAPVLPCRTTTERPIRDRLLMVYLWPLFICSSLLFECQFETLFRAKGRGCRTVQPKDSSVFQAAKWWVRTSLIRTMVFYLPRYFTDLRIPSCTCCTFHVQNLTKHVGCRRNWFNQAMWCDTGCSVLWMFVCFNTL